MFASETSVFKSISSRFGFVIVDNRNDKFKLETGPASQSTLRNNVWWIGDFFLGRIESCCINFASYRNVRPTNLKQAQIP
jgi:hypothetical protein